MTDEQRKQIEEASQKCWVGHTNAKWLIDVYESQFTTGAEFGLSLADNRVKELEDALQDIIANRYGFGVFNMIEKAMKLLTPTDNDKEQKG